MVVPRSSGPSGPSGGSGAAGSGHNNTSLQGSGNSRLETVHYGEALAEPNAEIAGAHDIDSTGSSLYVAIPHPHGSVGHRGRLSWPPWRRNSEQRYQDVPVAEDPTPDAIEGQDVVSPPLSPRSVQYSDGHNSDAEQETLLHPATVSVPAVAAIDLALESPNLATSSQEHRFAERAREAVAQRNARQRASYIPGAAGFFTWFRNSWASSRRGSRTPGPSTDELGFRPRSEKSAPGSKVSSTRGNSRGPARSQRSKQSSAKSELNPQQDSDESPPTPHSSQFPTPPPTHLEAHALVWQRSQASSTDRQYRTVSVYSTGGGSVGSGNTVYYDAMDAPPLPSPLSPHLLQSRSETSVRLVPQPNPNAFASEMGELAERGSSSGSELLPPPPIHIQPHSPLSIRPTASLRSVHSSLRSLAYQADDVLDEPPPLPSASLDRRNHRGQPVSSSPPPSYSDSRQHPPPGLEEYNYDRMPAFDRSESHTTRATSDLDVLEEEPPTAGSQWRRIAGSDEPLPFEDRLTPPVRVTTHFRSSSILEYVSLSYPAVFASISFMVQSSRGALTPPRAGSVHSAPLLPHSAPASFTGRRVSSRAPSSSGGRRGTSLISRKSSRSHSPWSRTSREGHAFPPADGLTRMPSLSAFGGRPSPPPLDEHAVGEALQHPDVHLVRPPSQSRPSSLMSFGYAV
jgi:hypothetical protein